jgi:hypothetical protein
VNGNGAELPWALALACTYAEWAELEEYLRKQLIQRLDSWQAAEAKCAQEQTPGKGDRSEMQKLKRPPQSAAQMRLKELPPKVAREIARLSVQGLLKYHDQNGQKLHGAAIHAEIRRRVQEGNTPGHPNENPHLRRHRERRAMRTLGAPLEVTKPKIANRA